jgi:hypothetical protein
MKVWPDLLDVCNIFCNSNEHNHRRQSKAVQIADKQMQKVSKSSSTAHSYGLGGGVFGALPVSLQRHMQIPQVLSNPLVVQLIEIKQINVRHTYIHYITLHFISLHYITYIHYIHYIH